MHFFVLPSISIIRDSPWPARSIPEGEGADVKNQIFL